MGMISMQNDISLNSYNNNDQTFEQWTAFQEGRPLDACQVRPFILQSWIRSRRYGVSCRTAKEACVKGHELESILARNADLIACSKQIMHKIIKLTGDARSFISLADSNAVILHVSFNSSFGDSPNHGIGDIFTEERRGTNGIGTCLVEGRTLDIIAAEHYCQDEHGWCCSSAPIFDINSSLVGVFNISVRKEYFHDHTRGMVEAAATAVTEQLSLRCMLNEQKAILDILDEGIIVLASEGDILSINKKACEMLGQKSSPVGQRITQVLPAHEALNTILNKKECVHGLEIELSNRASNASLILSSAAAPSGGTVLTLREARCLREAAKRVMGVKAIYTFDKIIGESEAIRQAIHQSKRAAQSDITTLIQGESGTGKELFAQSIHNAGSRSKEAFIVVNCGAIPRNLVESELFGYDEGAYTGAGRGGRPGKFELADKGTIFLDEIGEMPLEAQVSLLRLLQNGEVTRVGGKVWRHVDVRIIAATNRDLLEAVRQKLFREDLFFRLNAFTIYLPGLPTRTGDIELLAQHFLQKFSKKVGKTVSGFSRKAIEALNAYTWPGNVRELENYVERAVLVTSHQEVQPEDLPEHILRQQAIPHEAEGESALKLSAHEALLIKNTLLQHGGNLKKTAEQLGIARSTLYLKMKKWGLCKENFRPTRLPR